MTSTFDSALPRSGCHAYSDDPHTDVATDAVWRSIKAALPSLGNLQRAALGIYGRLEPDRALVWTVEELGELAQAVRCGEDRARLEEELGQLTAWM